MQSKIYGLQIGPTITNSGVGVYKLNKGCREADLARKLQIMMWGCIYEIRAAENKIYGQQIRPENYKY